MIGLDTDVLVRYLAIVAHPTNVFKDLYICRAAFQRAPFLEQAPRM